MNDKTPSQQPEPADISREEMDELKREMQSARLAAWVQAHQKQVVAGLAAVILLIAAASYWREHEAARRASAATLYHQALAERQGEARKALLERVVKDYGDTAYAGLSRLLLAAADEAKAEAHLKALVADAPDREIGWQARLDLAALYLRKGNKQAARETLKTPVGRDYEQLRQYLLARASADDASRVAHLQKAARATSHDAALKKAIEDWLAKLDASSRKTSSGKGAGQGAS